MKFFSLILLVFLASIGCHSGKNTVTDNNTKNIPTGYYFVKKNSQSIGLKLRGTQRVVYLDPTPIITAEDFNSARVGKNPQGNYYVGIDLTLEGGDEWSEGTRKAAGDSIAVVINKELIQIWYIAGQQMDLYADMNPVCLDRADAEKLCNAILSEMAKHPAKKNDEK